MLVGEEEEEEEKEEGKGGGGKKEEEEEDKAEDYDQVVDMVNHGDRQFGGRDDSNQSSFD